MGTQRATTPDEGWVFVAKLEDLREKRIVVGTAGRARVAVVADADRVFAVDNRCPHMGFPLDQGSVEDGILTCHWHQARFDLASGRATRRPAGAPGETFDAGVDGGDVWVDVPEDF